MFEGYFVIFWQQTLITLSKMTLNLKVRTYFRQNFMEIDMKIFSDSKALIFGVWGLKTSLGQFGPKVFCKGLIWLQFSQTRPYFLKNHETNPIQL